MPTYTFENRKSGKIWDELMSISEMEEYLAKNKDVHTLIHKVNIVSGVQGISYKSDQGMKEVFQKISEKHPTSALAQQYGKKTIKQVKTEQVIAKHRARQRAKTK